MATMPAMGLTAVTQQKEGILKKFGRWYSARDRTLTRINPPHEADKKAKRFSERMAYKKSNNPEFRRFKDELPPKNSDLVERAIQRGWCIKGFTDMCVKSGGSHGVSNSALTH